jgi:acetyltransferase-like isoleucine patch superfamily enzyme
MSSLRKFLATSGHPIARTARGVRRGVQRFTLPAPRPLVRPALGAYLVLRSLYHFGARTLVCEPLFKAYCTRYGRRVRTGVFIHWVQGKGDIILGDDVLIDGKCSFTFAVRFSDHPTLVVGDRTGIGHGCTFSVGKRIAIGRDCRIASEVWIFDSSGHPADPSARLAGLPPAPEEVRPVTVGDNVWIGARSIIFPGVTIGDGGVISAGSVVMGDVPANTVVAGNPARKIAALRARPIEEVQQASA